MQLVKYEAARRALAEAHRVDEAKAIRDKAVAFQAYARQVKDDDLIRWAKEIRIRAERRVGELLKEMAARRERRTKSDGLSRKAKVSENADTLKTLKDLGFDKDQAAQYQQLAELPAEEFEARLEHVSRDPATMSSARVLQPVPKAVWIDPFEEQREVWAGILGWLRGPRELPPFEDLKRVRPMGGLRTALMEEYRAARAYMADLDRLHEEGFL